MARKNCNFDTKDAFWHAKNVVARNSTVKGEYLAWYCENVTFLAFEKSGMEATVTTRVMSIKVGKPYKNTHMHTLHTVHTFPFIWVMEKDGWMDG